MTRRNIYFVEAGFSFDESVYLPYATGTIAAYLKSQPRLSEKYNIAGFIFRREKIQAAVAKTAAPFAVGFSCSIWNMNYNLALAEEIKKAHPGVIIIFGGHSVSPEEKLLERYPFIDYCMFGEGERHFADILLAEDCGNRMTLTDVSFRDGGNIYYMPQTSPSDISELPSPYLTGVFDDIIASEPETDFLTVLETNRGCPYSCAYCDWCSGKKVRQFPMEKVLAEINWLSENKIEYCFCADSNFGMFERDAEIAKALAQKKLETGYPKTFRPCYAKNNDKTVYEICTVLNSAKMDKGATFAYQTLSTEALVNINRKNLTLEHFSELMAKYTADGIPTYSELILGLPGETRQSFCEGICRLLENGQHNSLSVYHCELLPNSPMSVPAYVSKHRIKTIDIAFNHIHSEKKKEETEEYSHIIQSTATLSKDDWVYCNLFAVCVQCFHALGLTRFVSLFFNKALGVSYFDFYSGLLNFIMSSGGKASALFNEFKSKFDGSLGGDWNYVNPVFGTASWTFEEGAFLELASDIGGTFAEIMPYLSSFGCEEKIFSELLAFQKNVLNTCGKEETASDFSFDFASFFNVALKNEPPALEEKKTSILFYADAYYSDAENWARETVWYGRRRGATVLKYRSL